MLADLTWRLDAVIGFAVTDLSHSMFSSSHFLDV